MSSPLTRLSAAAVTAIRSTGSLGRHLPTTASVADTTMRFQSSKAAAPKGKPTKFSSKTSTTASSSKKKKGSSSSTGQRDKSLDLVIRALDAPRMKEPPISEEERERRYKIGRNHVIGRFEQHNAFEHDLACKLVMKQHAINMLPRNSKIRDEALRTDYNLDEVEPPLARHIPNETPPVPSVKNSRFSRRTY